MTKPIRCTSHSHVAPSERHPLTKEAAESLYQSISKQESLAIAKITARCVLYIGACPENFRESLSTPKVTFPEIFNGLGPMLHRFGARTRFMCSWPHPYSTLILGVFPLHQIAHVGRQRAHGPKLFGREIIFEEFQCIWIRYLIVTDGQTDGQTDDLLSHHRALR